MFEKIDTRQLLDETEDLVVNDPSASAVLQSRVLEIIDRYHESLDDLFLALNERDHARRKFCEERSHSSELEGQSYVPTPSEVAEDEGWDCYKMELEDILLRNQQLAEENARLREKCRQALERLTELDSELGLDKPSPSEQRIVDFPQDLG